MWAGQKYRPVRVNMTSLVSAVSVLLCAHAIRERGVWNRSQFVPRHSPARFVCSASVNFEPLLWDELKTLPIGLVKHRVKVARVRTALIFKPENVYLDCQTNLSFMLFYRFPGKVLGTYPTYYLIHPSCLHHPYRHFKTMRELGCVIPRSCWL